MLSKECVKAGRARDCMPYDQQLVFFEQALQAEKALGIPVAHETHRSRATFTPWNTAALLQHFNDLKIAADFSHWCCVCESLLEDQVNHLDLAMERTIHIHGRVGYRGGPQVPHPGAPEYKLELGRHEEWWLEICRKIKRRGEDSITFTPEFGPPPWYMHTVPYADTPVTDLWSVCLWMMTRFQKTFAEQQT